MRHGPLTAIVYRPCRLPFNGCTLQPGMFSSESAVATWSASIARLQRLYSSGCTFRLVPVSKISRNPACRKPTSTLPTVKPDATQCQPLLCSCRPARRVGTSWTEGNEVVVWNRAKPNPWYLWNLLEPLEPWPASRSAIASFETTCRAPPVWRRSSRSGYTTTPSWNPAGAGSSASGSTDTKSSRKPGRVFPVSSRSSRP